MLWSPVKSQKCRVIIVVHGVVYRRGCGWIQVYVSAQDVPTRLDALSGPERFGFARRTGCAATSGAVCKKRRAKHERHSGLRVSQHLERCDPRVRDVS